jgi:phytoene synthase
MPKAWPERHPAFFPAADRRSREASDLSRCRDLLRGGSRSFHAASLLLPRRVRDPATALYAFCRLADDAVDLGGDDRIAALASLRERLDRAYAGRPVPVPADRAFAATVARFAVPRALPDALLEGFQWDAEGRRYATLSHLRAYAARVAGTVGAMMAVLMGVRDPDTVARACDLGVAMQLTNIARDVGEDARCGRLYLPLDWLNEAGIDPDAFLARPVFSEALAGVIRRLLAAADGLYARADIGVARLPPSCRPGIAAARHLYAAIGGQVERRAFDAVSSRAVVSPGRKASALARAARAALAGRAVPTGWTTLPLATGRSVSPPLDETRFLVDAAVEALRLGWAPARPARVGERAIWLFELFQRLDLARSSSVRDRSDGALDAGAS